MIFTHTIKVFCCPTSIFVGFDVAFMYSKTTLEISSRTNILFKAALTGYQIDNAITITMKDPSRIISSIGDIVIKKLCLTCNNSIFNNRNFLQTDGTAQGLHLSCSCSDIAMSK